MIQTAQHTPPLWIRWTVVGLWMGVIFFMSSQSNSGEESGAITQFLIHLVGASPTPDQAAEVHHLLRKASHFTEYAVFAMLLAWAQPSLTLGRTALTWGFATLYAASDEWHQTFVPNRGPAVTDVMIDSAGALTGLAIWLLLSRRK
jgi:VanZ family protein